MKRKNTLKIFLSFLSLLYVEIFFLQVKAQVQEQKVVRGRLVEELIKKGISDAELTFEGEAKIYKVQTNAEGEFAIALPYGRYFCRLHKRGYQLLENYNLLITSAEEKYFELEATPIFEIESVSIIGDSTARYPFTGEVSKRKIEPEETGRWAGTLYDPLRAVSYLPGISFINDDHNDIVMRGRSPLGVLWRIEGIDIPNPNHFQNPLSNGGPISFINNNILHSLEVKTGAMEARYGNALSGVVDMRFRSGNVYRTSRMFMLSAGGLEAMLELPFAPKQGISMIAAYRYSTLALLDQIGIKAGDLVGVPAFQDFSFKLHLPKTKAGKWSVFGIIGQSNNNMLESKLPKSVFWDKANPIYQKDINKEALRLFLGLKNEFLTSKGWFWQTSLGYNLMQNGATIDTLSLEQMSIYRSGAFARTLHKITIHPNTRFRHKNIAFEAGAILDVIHYASRDTWQFGLGDLKNSRMKVLSGMVRAYAQIQFKWAARWSLEAGTHWLYYTANQRIEPDIRAKLAYWSSEKSVFSIFTGSYAQVLPLEVLYWQDSKNNLIYLPSKNLRAQEITFSHTVYTIPSVSIRNEIFFNYSFNYFTSISPSSFSSINWGESQSPAFRLANTYQQDGKGLSWGWDFSVEKKITKRYYFIINAALLQAKYKASDNRWYSSRFHRTINANILAGYEKPVGRRKQTALLADARLAIAEGNRYTPISYLASSLLGRTVYDSTLTNQYLGKPYFRIDVQIGMRINQRKLAHQFYISVQNVSNRANIGAEIFDSRYQKPQFQYQLGLFPLIFYKLNW
jgi:hypothetical protein